MIFYKTKIEGVYVVELEPRKDERGYFMRAFCQEELKKSGIDFQIRQINRSFSKHRGTVRGLHYQLPPKEEEKIVQCLAGRIFDVAVDLRDGSPTFGKWIGEELSEDNMKMLLVPKGCSHGFQSLSDNTLIQYFVSEFYSPAEERGVRWNDPFFNIAWPIADEVFMSEKDKNWPFVKKESD